MTSLKFVWNESTKAILKKNKVRELTPPDFKTSIAPVVNTTALAKKTHKHEVECKGSPTDAHIHSQCFCQRQENSAEESPPQMATEQVDGLKTL